MKGSSGSQTNEVDIIWFPPNTVFGWKALETYWDLFGNRTGDHQSALFAFLFAHFLFWHMRWLTRKQANDKTQLFASLPWSMQNCKQMTRLNSLHPSLGACKIANKNQKTKKKRTKKKNNPMSEALWPSRSSWFSCFFLFSHFAWMYHWLGSQSASVNILLFRPYSPCPFPSSHTMKGQPMLTQPHLWISSKCVYFLDFLMVWAHSQKVTLKNGRKYNTGATWKYNQQKSFSMASDISFQTLQYMPHAVFFSRI